MKTKKKMVILVSVIVFVTIIAIVADWVQHGGLDRAYKSKHDPNYVRKPSHPISGAYVVPPPSPSKLEPKSTVSGGLSESKSQSLDINSDFTYAVEGESWTILDNDVAVTSYPKTYSDRDEFERDLVTILNYGDKVEIIKMKVVGRWKYCKVKGNLYGWISANNVAKARLVR